MPKQLSWLEASIAVLKSDVPMSQLEITEEIRTQGLRAITGKTPEQTVGAQLYLAVVRGDERVLHVGPNQFQRGPGPIDSLGSSSPNPAPSSRRKSTPSPAKSKMTFLDAAERVLDLMGERNPMQVGEIVGRALKMGLIATDGLTPTSTLSAQIGTDTRTRLARGELPRFTNPRRGYYGLSIWEGVGITKAVNQHRSEIADQLKDRLRGLTPSEFEALVGQLLVALGVEDAEVVGRSGDRGIDVRGTLVVANVIRRRMVAQAKRWTKSNVGSSEVRNLRGSLGPHDLALLASVSGFSADAVEESERADATPVALLDGDGIVDLMFQHEIGVQASTLELFSMTDFALSSDEEEPEPIIPED